MSSGVERRLSLAKEWAEIYRMIRILSKRSWPAVLAGLCRAREILLAGVPEAAERALIASELGGLGKGANSHAPAPTNDPGADEVVVPWGMVRWCHSQVPVAVRGRRPHLVGQYSSVVEA